MKETRRLLHSLMNVLTSSRGFIELAIEEQERSKRFEYMRRAEKELDRATDIARALAVRVEAKANQYGEGFTDD